VPVRLLVLDIERPFDLPDRFPVQMTARYRNGQFPGLPEVTQIRIAADRNRFGCETFLYQRAGSLLLHAHEQAVQFFQLESAGTMEECLHVMALDIRREQAEGAEQAGIRRDHRFLNLHRAGHTASVNWTAAAERNQREPSHVAPALGGY